MSPLGIPDDLSLKNIGQKIVKWIKDLDETSKKKFILYK